MYKGYELLNFTELHLTEIGLTPSSRKEGDLQYKNHKEAIESQLNQFISSSGILDGSKMQESWFPQIESDIFISHSHKDKDLAIGLAAWLKSIFELNTFIDSCVWGYANDLLKQIDDTYCLNKESQLYDYQKRNDSTSHIHMMLSTALAKMIDNTECIIFLNTPNSITSKDVVDKSNSPWIYYEIAISNLVQKRKKRTVNLSEKHIPIEHKIDTSDFTKISYKTLDKWRIESRWTSGNSNPLEILYSIAK